MFPVQENDPSCTELGCNIASVCQIMLSSSGTPLDNLVALNKVSLTAQWNGLTGCS